MRTTHKEQGFALLMFVFVLVLLGVGYAVSTLDVTDFALERDRKTAFALAQAKAALLSFSAEPVTAAPLSAALVCAQNCPRPGDLPCPDVNNDGIAEPVCSTQASRLGRLPWRTLGLGDLRDSSGERLWYAVSEQYKNNPRVLPLNSESFGTISLRGAQGGLTYSTTSRTGVAAVVIAPNAALIRQDSLVVQNRAAVNVAANYLDIAFGEDNAVFTDGATDGFISGEILVGGALILNDIVLPITRDEMNAVMETRVLAEVMQALVYNFCPVGQADIKARTCTGSFASSYVPDPASVSEATCITALSSADIANGDCSSDSSASIGRIPVGGNASSPAGLGWENKESNSILRGESDHNWFQQNGWRETILYAVAPACRQTTLGCSGAGFLVLENSLTPSGAPLSSNKVVVVISGGRSLTGLKRVAGEKVVMTSYLEDENILPLDDTYSRYLHDAGKNDRTISIP